MQFFIYSCLRLMILLNRWQTENFQNYVSATTLQRDGQICCKKPPEVNNYNTIENKFKKFNKIAIFKDRQIGTLWPNGILYYNIDDSLKSMINLLYSKPMNVYFYLKFLYSF